LILIFEVVLRG